MAEPITIIITLGAAVAKALAKDEVGNSIAETAVSHVIDLFTAAGLKEHDKRANARRLADVADQIAAQLQADWLGSEFGRLDEGNRAAILREVIATLEAA